MSLHRMVLGLLMVLASVSPCLGWGRAGHRIVGAIASSYLNDNARAEVRGLLEGQTLATASTWADEIKSDPDWKWTRPLHYVNVPRGEKTVDLTRDCPDGRCVVGAIEKYTTVLSDRRRPRKERVEALKFLVHFIGDIHQPLHSSFADDRGGNDIEVRFFGEPKYNLHSVWDSALIRHRIGFDWVALALQIRATITSKKVRAWSQSSDPVQWANESLALVIRVVLPVPRNGNLDTAYYERSINTVEERLAMAGVRLARLLNSILGAGRAKL